MAHANRNRLLLSLPAESREGVLALGEQVELPIRTTLVEPGEKLSYAYFLEAGLASVVASNHDGTQHIEVGHLGYEGLAGFHIVLGVDQTPSHTFMQVAGLGHRVPTTEFLALMRADVALREHLLRYVHTYQLQLAYSALANGRYSIPERLARWLLMCQDRLQSDNLPLTHEFLSLMLGVRRSGVTNEIHVLEGEHAIRATRGMIHIRDRDKLLQLANGSYGMPEAEYQRLIEGPLAP